MRIICLFNLKPGVDVSEYEAWAKTRDIPTVNGLGSVTSFTVHKATGVFRRRCRHAAFPVYRNHRHHRYGRLHSRIFPPRISRPPPRPSRALPMPLSSS